MNKNSGICELTLFRSSLVYMATYSDPFNKLLEEYLFQVSPQVIDLADPETQGKLIDLIH